MTPRLVGCTRKSAGGHTYPDLSSITCARTSSTMSAVSAKPPVPVFEKTTCPSTATSKIPSAPSISSGLDPNEFSMATASLAALGR